MNPLRRYFNNATFIDLSSTLELVQTKPPSPKEYPTDVHHPNERSAKANKVIQQLKQGNSYSHLDLTIGHKDV